MMDGAAKACQNPFMELIDLAIEELERQVWHALQTGDRAADRALLHTEFLGVYPSGFATRADHVAQLNSGPSVAEFTLSQITVRQFSEDAAIISYRADFTRPGKSAEAMLVSSVWERRAGDWVNTFSQDTPLD